MRQVSALAGGARLSTGPTRRLIEAAGKRVRYPPLVVLLRLIYRHETD